MFVLICQADKEQENKRTESKL